MRIVKSLLLAFLASLVISTYQLLDVAYLQQSFRSISVLSSVLLSAVLYLGMGLIYACIQAAMLVNASSDGLGLFKTAMRIFITLCTITAMVEGVSVILGLVFQNTNASTSLLLFGTIFLLAVLLAPILVHLLLFSGVNQKASLTKSWRVGLRTAKNWYGKILGLTALCLGLSIICNLLATKIFPKEGGAIAVFVCAVLLGTAFIYFVTSFYGHIAATTVAEDAITE